MEVPPCTWHIGSILLLLGFSVGTDTAIFFEVSVH
jgi:hypothetical protein